MFEIADRWASINALFHERISDYADVDAGYLKITATAPRPALPLIASYSRLYPNVRIDFTLLNWTQNMAAVRERAVDIAIVTASELDDGMYALEIERVPYRAFIRSDHPLARRRHVSLKDLTDIQVITPEDGSLTQRVLLEAAAEHDIEFRRVMKVTTFAVAKEAILHDLGVGILLANSVHDTARLIALPIKEIERTFSNQIVVPSDKQNLRLIRRFLDVV